MEDRYSSAFDEVRASDEFKADMVRRMRALNEIEPQPQPVRVPRRLRKRTLTVLLAAAILLIGGTALALGISRGYSLKELAIFSTATGAANVMCSGTQAADRETVEALMDKVVLHI